MLIGLSVQDGNACAFGVGPNGRIDRTRRQSVIDAVLDAMTDLGFADKVPNPKHGTVHLLSATGADRWRIRSPPPFGATSRWTWAHASIIDLSPIRRRARWREDELIESEEHALPHR